MSWYIHNVLILISKSLYWLVGKLFILSVILFHYYSKYKAFPLQAQLLPRGWVEVLLYSSMTTALEGGEWSAAGPGRILHPEKGPVPNIQEAE